LTRIAIVVMARDPRRAKTRLRQVLTPRHRASLALAMFDDVIAAASRTRRPVLVVTDARSIAARARKLGARATLAPARGTRAAAAHGLRLAARDGAEAALVIAADLPLATAADLRRVIAAGRRAEVVIIPDGRGSGTNALFLRPPSRIAPLFGPRSLAAHRRAAGSTGTVLRIARLGVDVDMPADLLALRRSRTRAGINTRRVLDAIAGGEAPSTRRGSPSPRAALSRTRPAPRR
jgi:2-phospho-L-lactate guanylyltransferase